MARMRRHRVTYRASGTVVAEIDIDPAAPPDPIEGGGPVGRVLVLPMASPGIAGHESGSRQAVEVVVDGWRFELEVEDADRADLRARATRGRDAAAHDGPTEVRAIIPGRVVSVAVNPGDAVTAGDRLLAVEAMKMENEVRAPRGGIVDRVAVGAGETVELGDVLVVIR
jgi:biotin carboxyl carrier protein